MALGGVHVRIDAEGERLVDQQLVQVEVAHQVRQRVSFVVAHPGEVGQILAELNLVREPGVRDGLIVELVRPRVGDRLEQQAVGDTGAEDSGGGGGDSHDQASVL